MRSIPAAVAAVSLWAGASGAFADVLVQVPASHDNTLYQDPTGSTSNGAGPGVFVGATNTPSIRRGLMSFDIASAVPVGATITGVTLTLHMSSAQATVATVSLYPTLTSWGEGTSNAGVSGGDGTTATPGDATWTYRFYNTTSWGSPGGDFGAAASASRAIAGAGFYSWTSAAMVADAQGWLANPAGNFGWTLVGAESIAGSAKRFDSRENGTASFRPELDVTYVPGPSGLALLGLGAIGVRRRRR